LGRENRVVTVRVQLDHPQETMRITVVVPEEADERSVRDIGVARAKDCARRFSGLEFGSNGRPRRDARIDRARAATRGA
jgi:hypothetical protein